MIVQCESCHTKYNFNDDLLKSEGSKVKCTRCASVFQVYPPEPIGEALDEADLSDAQKDFDADSGGLGADSDMDLDFDDSFEDDIMEEFEDLEAEYHSEPVSVEENTEMDVSHEDDGKEYTQTVADETETEASVSTKKKKGKAYLLIILAIVILGLIGALYAVVQYYPHLVPNFNLAEEKPSSQQESVDAGANRLEILTVDGSFVDSEKAGRLFVISGKVRNSYPKSRSFILVKGCILDDRGQVVKEKTSFSGNILSQEELMTLSLEEVTDVMKNRYGIDKKNLNVRSGASVDFMIVFEDLPDNLTEFTVGAVSSSPGNLESNQY